MCFTIFYNEKTRYKAIKTRESKSRRIHIFPKGLMVSVQNWKFFQLYFGSNTGKENVFYDMLKRKTAFL